MTVSDTHMGRTRYTEFRTLPIYVASAIDEHIVQPCLGSKINHHANLVPCRKRAIRKEIGKQPLKVGIELFITRKLNVDLLFIV